MNNPGLVNAVLALGLATGCATNEKQFVATTEQSLARQTGADIHWNRTDADFDEAQTTISILLKKELTPVSAVQIALVNNPRLQAEMEEIGISRAELVQAGLLRNPEFAASWRFPDRPPSAANTEYSITGELLDLVFLPYRKQIAAQSLEQTQLRVADEILALSHEVQTAFFTMQAAEQLLNRLKLIVEVNEAAVEVAQRQYEAGNITELELANHQAVFAQSRLAVAQTQRELREHRQRLNKLLGLWGNNTGWTISNQLPAIPSDAISNEDLEALAVSQRKDLASLKQNADTIASALALKSKTRFSPAGVQVGVNAERESDKTRLIGPTLVLELPIFDQGQGALGQLSAQYRQAQRRLEALAIEIRSEVNAAIDEMIAVRDVAQYLGKVLLPLRIKIVNHTLLQYNAMQLSTYELLAAKERELEMEREYVEAWRDYWIARANLERAVGGKLSFGSSVPEAPSFSEETDHGAEEHHVH